jgi:hypothetical protein
VRNPAELYIWAEGAVLDGRPGPLLLALGGFVDAGNIQKVLATHLLESSESEVIAAFAVDELIDYRDRRPPMTFEVNRWTHYETPEMVLHRLEDRDGQTYHLLTGPEPDFQWERLAAAIWQVMERLGIELVVTTHGIPMAVPHTRPIGMTAHATDPLLIGGAASPFGTVQVPASFAAFLEYRLQARRESALGFAIHVPHYLGASEWAEGALAALTAITDATALNLPNDDLVTRAGENAAAITREVDDNAEVGQLVSALEQQYDAFVHGQEQENLLAQPGTRELPSAEELGAEFEEFLRSVEEG